MNKIIVVFIAIVLLAASTVSSAFATTEEYSHWIRNLSQDADPQQLFNHDDVKVAVSGRFVHVVWRASKRDFSGDVRLYYRRSTDRGRTFQSPRILVKADPGSGNDIYFPGAWNSVAASGPYVHVFYRFYSQASISFSLNYLRSADNGGTFVKKLWAANAGYDGVYIAANHANIAVGWATNTGHSSNLYCAYSNDGGGKFTSRRVAYDDDTDGRKAYLYLAHDLVSSGDYVYLLGSVEDENWFSSQKHLYLWGSKNRCQSFNAPRKVNLKAVNDGYYGATIQAGNYTPNLAAKGALVDVVWINVDNPGSFDGWAALTLRVRRSIDGGATLAAPTNLFTFPSGYSNGAAAGLETIVRNGSNVYVGTTMQTAGHAGSFWWRRSDGEAWSKGKKLSDGGWWPQLGVTSAKPAAVYAATGSYFVSKNSGVSFDGGAAPRYDLGDYRSPGFTVDDLGISHYVWASEYSGYMSHEILYRRLAPAPDPDTQNRALRLDKVGGDPTLPEYLQTAATSATNFAGAMTAEFWLRRGSDEAVAYENLLSKRRSLGEASFEVGAWSNFQIYGRIVTDQSADTYYGNWLGTGETLARGIWTHIAMTYNARQTTDNWRIYVNGVLKAKATIKGRILTDRSPLLLGDPGLSAAANSSFLVDELRLWSVARTPAQIQVNMRRKLTGNETGLSVYYTFDKSFKDMTGHGNDAVPKYKEDFVTTVPFVYGGE